MIDIVYILKVVFYQTEAGNEPVRDWLKDLSRDDKRQIGEDNQDSSTWLAIRDAVNSENR